MFFKPSRFKHKKYFKGTFPNRIVNFKFSFIFSGIIALKAMSFGFCTIKNLEATRQCIKRVIKKTGSLEFNVFPQDIKTRKSLGMRMGKGKGSFSHFVCKIRPGEIICTICNVNLELAIKALKAAQFRLPVLTKIVKN